MPVSFNAELAAGPSDLPLGCALPVLIVPARFASRNSLRGVRGTAKARPRAMTPELVHPREKARSARRCQLPRAHGCLSRLPGALAILRIGPILVTLLVRFTTTLVPTSSGFERGQSSRRSPVGTPSSANSALERCFQFALSAVTTTQPFRLARIQPEPIAMTVAVRLPRPNSPSDWRLKSPLLVRLPMTPGASRSAAQSPRLTKMAAALDILDLDSPSDRRSAARLSSAIRHHAGSSAMASARAVSTGRSLLDILRRR
jgi:hypothetical protein